MAKIYCSSVLKKMTPTAAPDNYKSLQARIDSAPEKAAIVLPDGDFYFSEMLKVYDKSLRFEGGDSTRLIFRHGVSGIEVRSRSKNWFSNIRIVTNGEKRDAQGALRYPNTHGFKSYAMCVLENIVVANFGGIGFSVTADVNVGSNASKSILRDCEAIECGSHGFYFQGGDANVINVQSCDARDCGGAGFWDESFFGQTYIGCMGHANKLGHFHSRGGANHAVFLGCYGEGGDLPSRLEGSSQLIGGIHENGVIGGHGCVIMIGSRTNGLNFGDLKIKENSIQLGDRELMKNEQGNFAMQWVMEIVNANSELKAWDNVTRKPPVHTLAVPQIFNNNRLVTYARSVKELMKWEQWQKFDFIPGDTIHNQDYSEGQPVMWVCKKAGKHDVAQWDMVYAGKI